MKKVLLVCDGSHFSEAAFKMASYLQTLQPMLLTGVFLSSEILKYVYLDVDFVTAELATALQEEEDEQIAKSTERFKTLCRQHGIEYHVHNDPELFSLETLQKEMRFADLAIIGSEVFYKSFDEEHLNNHLTAALREAECPVLLVPEHFGGINSIVLAYDGSKDSVFAIKQFATLLPQLCTKEALLVYVSEGGEPIPALSLAEELMARHFTNLTIHKLDINAKEYLATWLSERKNALMVCGSFGRSSLSSMFRRSFITEVMLEHYLPVFVAHQ